MNWNYPGAPVRPPFADLGKYLIRWCGVENNVIWNLISARAARVLQPPFLFGMMTLAFLAGYQPRKLLYVFLILQVIFFWVLASSSLTLRQQLNRKGLTADILASPITSRDVFEAFQRHTDTCYATTMLMLFPAAVGLSIYASYNLFMAALMALGLSIIHLYAMVVFIGFYWLIVRYGIWAALLAAAALVLLVGVVVLWPVSTYHKLGFAGGYAVVLCGPILIGWGAAMAKDWCKQSYLDSLRNDLSK